MHEHAELNINIKIESNCNSSRQSNQLAHHQEGKCVQRQPLPLQPVSV